MGDNKWSQARRDKRNQRKQQKRFYEREFLMDEEEKEYRENN